MAPQLVVMRSVANRRDLSHVVLSVPPGCATSSRVESSWRPASAEEGFEIVRRLFQPLSNPAQFKDRDVVARAFADLYRSQQQEFPPECRDSAYEQRLKAA